MPQQTPTPKSEFTVTHQGAESPAFTTGERPIASLSVEEVKEAFVGADTFLGSNAQTAEWDIFKTETIPAREAWVDESESADKYATALVDLSKTYGKVAVYDKVFDIQKEFKDKADALKIDLSTTSRSQSWVMWDLGKQAYLAEHPDETDLDEYDVANPLLDSPEGEKVRHQIANRQLGWEYVNQLTHNPDFQPEVRLAALDDVEGILDAAREEDRSLHSYEYTSIGEIISRPASAPAEDSVDTEALLARIEAKLQDSEPAAPTKKESTHAILRRLEKKLRDTEPDASEVNEGEKPATRAHRRVSVDASNLTSNEVPPTTPPKDPETNSGDDPTDPESDETPEKKHRFGNFLKRVGRAAISTVDHLQVLRQVGMKNFLRERAQVAKNSIYAATEAKLWKIADKINATADNLKESYEYSRTSVSNFAAAYRAAIIEVGDDLNNYTEMWRQKKADALARKEARKQAVADRVAQIKRDERARRIKKNPALARPAL